KRCKIDCDLAKRLTVAAGHPVGNRETILDMSAARVADNRAYCFWRPAQLLRDRFCHGFIAKDRSLIHVLIRRVRQAALARAKLADNLVAIRRVFYQDLLAHVPLRHRRRHPGLLDSLLGDLSDQWARRVKSDYRQMLIPRKVDERLVVGVIPSPVL